MFVRERVGSGAGTASTAAVAGQTGTDERSSPSEDVTWFRGLGA